jgi:hypothetical protein
MWFGVRLSREQKRKRMTATERSKAGQATAPACAVEEQLFAVASGKQPGRSPENFLKIWLFYITAIFAPYMTKKLPPGLQDFRNITEGGYR